MEEVGEKGFLITGGIPVTNVRAKLASFVQNGGVRVARRMGPTVRTQEAVKFKETMGETASGGGPRVE